MLDTLSLHYGALAQRAETEGRIDTAEGYFGAQALLDCYRSSIEELLAQASPDAFRDYAGALAANGTHAGTEDERQAWAHAVDILHTCLNGHGPQG